MLSKKLSKNEIIAKRFLKNYLKNSSVSISGGKDSLVALDLSFKVGIERFVFCNTSMAFPGTEEYIKKLENYYNIEIEQVKPPREFLDLVDEIGYPSRRLRWCCEVYKFGPLANYVLKNKINFLITGIRSEESRKRKSYLKISKNPLIPTKQINPILYWKTKDIWDYIKYYKLPYHELYDKGYDRLGCWMCPFQNKEGFMRLKKNFPLIYNTLINSLYKNVNKFGRVGVRNIDNYIEEFAWTRNALPIRNIVVGIIEYEENEEFNKVLIKSKNFSTFLKIKQNLTLLKEKSEKIRINNGNFSIKITYKPKKLNIYKILIYCEKQINCVGCGACRSLCPNFAHEIKNNKLIIDFSKCSYCYNCLSTSKLRAACIARNYAPIRQKFEIININDENFDVIKNFLDLNKNIGLIKTRKKIDCVLFKLDRFFQKENRIKPLNIKNNGFYMYFTQEFKLYVQKINGFTGIHINAFYDDIEELINLFLRVIN